MGALHPVNRNFQADFIGRVIKKIRLASVDAGFPASRFRQSQRTPRTNLRLCAGPICAGKISGTI
jgi:hypothetical protein